MVLKNINISDVAHDHIGIFVTANFHYLIEARPMHHCTCNKT